MIGVPARNPLFTGREKEFGAIDKALAGGVAALTSGVAALHGMGGEGKTQAAVEYAYRHATEYDRIFMVRAEKPGEFESQMGGLAAELGLTEASIADQDAQYKAVIRWFQSTSSWLLLVDNAENLPDLKPKLPRHDRGHVLVTTRETVTPRFGSSVEIRHLSEEAGALLLLRCAGQARHESEGSPTEGEFLTDSFVMKEKAFADARRVSGTLGGLALALDHAGTYMARQSLAPAKYFALYEQYRTKLFEQGENPDHDTVTVTFTMALDQVEAIGKPKTWLQRFLGSMQLRKNVYDLRIGLAGAQLIRLCAFLAPDPIPDEVFRNACDEIEAPLSEFIEDDLAWENVVEAATRFALIRREIVHPASPFIVSWPM